MWEPSLRVHLSLERPEKGRKLGNLFIDTGGWLTSGEIGSMGVKEMEMEHLVVGW